MQMHAKFSGTGVALVTPFKADGTIDFDQYGQLINHVIEGGVDYIVVLGSTGEAATISPKEKQELVKCAVEQVDNRVAIVVGFSDNSTKRLVDEINAFDFTGVDAILTAVPAYNKPNQKGIFQHFWSVATAAPLAVILYNVPGRTASNIEAATVLQLARDFPNIVGIKEASGNFEQCMDIVKGNKRIDFALLSGDDIFTLPLLSVGFTGVISVVGNAFPAQVSEMVRTANACDFAKAKAIHYELLRIINLIFADGNPAGIKAALEIMGMGKARLRSPLVKVNAEIYQALKQLLSKLV